MTIKNASRVVSLMIGVLLTACSPKSNERLVEDSFREYVQMNFDNPKCLKEIVNISVSDTVSAEKTKNMAEKTLLTTNEYIELLKNRNDSLHNVFTTFWNNAGSREMQRIKSRYSGDQNMMSLVMKVMTNTYSVIEYASSADYKKEKSLEKDIESAIAELSNDSTFIVVYEIKARVENSNKDLKMETFYAKFFKDKTIVVTDNDDIGGYPPLISGTYTKLQEYMVYCEKHADVYERTINDLEHLITLLGI